MPTDGTSKAPPSGSGTATAVDGWAACQAFATDGGVEERFGGVRAAAVTPV
jgi:hypothetical protein